MAGRIQDAMRDAEDPGDQFKIVRFPAIAEEDEYLDKQLNLYRASEGDIPDDAQLVRRRGDALHPERYTAEMLKRYERTLSKRHWSALYQQNPVPDDGLYFTKDMFTPLVQLPGGMTRDRGYIYQAWDFAISETTRADFTVGATMSQDAQDDLEICEIVRGKWSDSHTIVEHMLDGYEKWRPLLVGVEDGQIWKAIRSIFVKRCAERQLYPVIELLKPITDKAARARALQGRMQHHKVYFDKLAPWYEQLEREFLRFQAGGNHDDIVDACAWVAQLCVGKPPPMLPRAEIKKSWKDKLRGLTTRGAPSAMAA